MNGDTQKAELEVSLVGDGPDGSAAEAMRDLAEATIEAAEAEERYQKLLARRRESSRMGGRAARDLHEEGIASGRVQDLTPHQRAERIVAQKRQLEEARRIAAEFGFDPNEKARRNRVLSGLAKQRATEEARAERAKPETVLDEARRKVTAKQRAADVKAAMANLTGGGGSPGMFSGLGGNLMHGLRAASPNAGAMLGRFAAAGGGIAGVGMGIHGAIQTTSIAARQQMTGAPWMDDFNRGRQQVSWVPGSETFFNVKDMMTGRAREVGGARRAMIAADIRAEQGTRQFFETAEQTRMERSAAGGVSAVAANARPGIADHRRATVAQEQQYKLAQRLLPLEESRVMANRELAEATADQAANLAGLEEREKRIADLRASAARWNQMTRNNPEGSGAYIQAAAAQERIKGQLSAAEEERRTFVTGQLRGGAQTVAQRRYQLAQSEVGIAEGRLSDLKEREGVAAGQATRLGMMGPGGRLQGQMALEMVQRYGIDNLPQDVIAAASSVAPETVRKAAERSGQAYVGDFARLAPDEYRDRLPDIRGKVDVAETDVKKAKDAADLAFKKQVEESVKAAGLPDGATVGQVLAESFRKMVDDMIAKAELASRVGGYVPPR